MPGDILGEKVEGEQLHYPGPWKPAPRSLGDPGAVREAIDLLAKAERPVIIAGSGVWWSDGAAALQVFVEATGIPFYTCLLYTSDAADERSSVDLGGRRIIKKKK